MFRVTINGDVNFCGTQTDMLDLIRVSSKPRKPLIVHIVYTTRVNVRELIKEEMTTDQFVDSIQDEEENEDE